jgi:hypothetical protein
MTRLDFSETTRDHDRPAPDAHEGSRQKMLKAREGRGWQ